MVDRFNALADRGSIELEAWFNIRLKADRSWIVDESSWRFPYRYIPTISILGFDFYWPSPLFGRKPDVLVSLYAGTSYILGRAIAKVRGIKVCYRVLKTAVNPSFFGRANSLEQHISAGIAEPTREQSGLLPVAPEFPLQKR